MFSCNLPPALLAEWPGFFTCYCGNTGVERIPKWVSTESRPWRRKFSRRSSRDSNQRPFNHESGALTTELSPPLILGMKTLPITINNFSGILLVVYCIELLCSGLLVLCSWPFQTFVLLCVWCRLFNVRIFTQTVQTIKLQIMQNNPLSRNCLEMLLHLKKFLMYKLKWCEK